MDQIDLLRHVIGVLNRLHVQYMVVGSLAGGHVYQPGRITSSQLLSVAAFDLGDEQSGPSATTTLVGARAQVYVAPDSFSLAVPVGEGLTELHKLDLTRDDIPLSASGTVPGAVPRQFAMDQQGEVLATVELPPDPAPPVYPRPSIILEPMPILLWPALSQANIVAF